MNPSHIRTPESVQTAMPSPLARCESFEQGTEWRDGQRQSRSIGEFTALQAHGIRHYRTFVIGAEQAVPNDEGKGVVGVEVLFLAGMVRTVNHRRNDNPTPKPPPGPANIRMDNQLVDIRHDGYPKSHFHIRHDDQRNGKEHMPKNQINGVVPESREDRERRR